jgi:hypothetical protein
VAISPTVIGRQLPPITSTIERGRLAFFAEAIGETDPIYHDVEAARAAGHPDLPALPTFVFGLRLTGADSFGWLTDLGVDVRFLLHGKQGFTYSSVAHAGDVVTLTPKIVDVYEKKGGALEFMITQTTVTKSDGTLIATMDETLVVRHPELEGK